MQAPQCEALAVQPQRLVRGGDGETARLAMCGDELRRQRFAGRVERGQRFVEEPERSLAQKKPGQRQAPFLPGRQILQRQVAGARKTHGGERGLDVPPAR